MHRDGDTETTSACGQGWRHRDDVSVWTGIETQRRRQRVDRERVEGGGGVKMETRDGDRDKRETKTDRVYVQYLVFLFRTLTALLMFPTRTADRLAQIKQAATDPRLPI